MSWISPLLLSVVPKEDEKPTRKRAFKPRPYARRPVEIDGVKYESMEAARKALRCAYRTLYKKIGENWRMK